LFVVHDGIIPARRPDAGSARARPSARDALEPAAPSLGRGALLHRLGHGRKTVDGKTADRGPGSLIYEPFGLVHQWGNPGSKRLTFLGYPRSARLILPWHETQQRRGSDL
jgi:hypothetical protein